MEVTLCNQQASLWNLENQVRQIGNSRLQGSLPSNTLINPRKQVKGITLRSGREIESRPQVENKNEEIAATPKTQFKDKEKEGALIPTLKPRIPYLGQLKKYQSDD